MSRISKRVVAYLCVSYLTHFAWLITVRGGGFPVYADIGLLLLAPALAPARLFIWILLVLSPTKRIMCTYPNFWVPAAVFTAGCGIAWMILTNKERKNNA